MEPVSESTRRFFTVALGILLSLFTLYEVNLARTVPLSQLAIFAMLGLVLCFLIYPRLQKHPVLSFIDVAWMLAAISCCSYLISQGDALGQRAGMYTGMDIAVGALGLLIVLEATRRSIGLALPILATVFLVYAFTGPLLPDWLFPHRGYGVERVVAQTFLRTEGVFGTALRVMFTYVFLFVVFGAFLEASGATQFIIRFASRVFGRSPGGPAKVAVLGSGLMGSLSGSAVANAVTTGTFTIPMMRSAGFPPVVAAGITAAAASGGALVPPVMGAGAYMMLEIVDPPVTFVEIAKAALVPAALYYFSILLMVHLYARRVQSPPVVSEDPSEGTLISLEGVTFIAALVSLIAFLLAGFSPFRAVTYALAAIIIITITSPRIPVQRSDRLKALALLPALVVGARYYPLLLGGQLAAWSDAGIEALIAVLVLGLIHGKWRPPILESLTKSARNGVSLICATACVGIIIGIVTLTGIGTAFPNSILPIAEQSLFLALLAIMACSIVLGMGLPSAVCYLLMATLIGPVLNRLGVIPLAAHLFIFYFGMMSMVTPPVALAAYASASIAGSRIMPTGLAAFRFSLVGFSLPFMFIYRPELLLLSHPGEPFSSQAFAWALGAAALGIFALAVSIAGYCFHPLSLGLRLLFLVSAVFLLFPDSRVEWAGFNLAIFDLIGTSLLAVLIGFDWKTAKTAAA